MSDEISMFAHKALKKYDKGAKKGEKCARCKSLVNPGSWVCSKCNAERFLQVHDDHIAGSLLITLANSMSWLAAIIGILMLLGWYFGFPEIFASLTGFSTKYYYISGASLIILLIVLYTKIPIENIKTQIVYGHKEGTN